MNLYEKLLKEGVDTKKYKERVQAVWKDLSNIEHEYLSKVEAVLRELWIENKELKQENEKFKTENESLKNVNAIEYKLRIETQNENEQLKNRLKTEKAELINAIKTVVSMNMNDITTILLGLIRENEQLKTENSKLEEDNAEYEAEKEAAYKETMNTQYGLDAEALDRLSEAFKKEILRNEQTEQN